MKESNNWKLTHYGIVILISQPFCLIWFWMKTECCSISLILISTSLEFITKIKLQSLIFVYIYCLYDLYNYSNAVQFILATYIGYL